MIRLTCGNNDNVAFASYGKPISLTVHYQIDASR